MRADRQARAAVGRVGERFARALTARLDARAAAALGAEDGCVSLGRARQAEVDEETLAAAAAEAMGLPFLADLSELPVSPEFLAAVPIAFARRHGLVGLTRRNGSVSVALADVAQWPQLQALAKLLRLQVEPALAPRAEIVRAINAAYQQQSGQARQVIEQLDRDDIVRQVEQAAANEDLLDVGSRAPVIKLVNLILFEAVTQQASDVHFQPYEDRLVVRFRIDGVLHDVFRPPRALQNEIVSRIKVMGGMNIAEHRLAQDGRATVEVGDRIVDLRIATLPTSFGERAVLRLLDKSVRLYTLDQLGMPPGVREPFARLIRQDHGIILVTGPTGSGKTTTLYAALQEVNAREMNVLTLEDPIEYRLAGISQTQVSDRKGMTFASGLRHVLRQDPDVIMVGEIRDGETAHMAIQSALTGHLVFSTLHTNDAAGAVARMLDLDVEPYLLASSLLGVMAQRLVRTLCRECRRRDAPTEADLRRWDVKCGDLPAEGLYRPEGCPSCLQTGYRGRTGVFELLAVTEPIRELILRREKASTIKALAVSGGMTTLRADGLAKARQGLTTMDEVARVTGRDEF